MKDQSISSRVLSTLRGRWYMVTKLTDQWRRRIDLRFGYYDRKFRRVIGHSPDYSNPRTYSEKLAWMRLYDHNPLYTQMVDKIAVRDYVRERLGEDVLIPCYGTWDKAEEIDFDSLPESFVLKCNHESGFVIICRDKSELDKAYVRAQLATRLKMNYYYRYHEWPYLDAKPRILAEKLLTDGDGGEPVDYKVHCFGGVPHYIFTMKDRHSEPVRGNYSLDWELLPFLADAEPPTEAIARPAHLRRLLEIATAVSVGLPYCRVDLYGCRIKSTSGR